MALTNRHGKEMKKVRNIIFDLGGVVIDLDRSEAIKALENLGLHDASALLGEYEQKGPFLMHEKGEISTSELFDMLLPQCKEGTRCTDIRDAFEQFLRLLPVERLKTITKLREKGFKVYVLSNTNPIMFTHWIDNAFRQEGKSMNDYFDGVVTSFQEKTCKPDPQIFKNLLDRYGLKPEETLMLDDSAANCASARSLGMEAIRIQPEGEDSFKTVCQKLLEEGPEK